MFKIYTNMLIVRELIINFACSACALAATISPQPHLVDLLAARTDYSTTMNQARIVSLV